MRHLINLITAIVLGGIGIGGVPAIAMEAKVSKGPVKVFVLSGQPNMTDRGYLGYLDY